MPHLTDSDSFDLIVQTRYIISQRCWRLALPCRPQQLGDGKEDGVEEGIVGSRSGGESGDGPQAPRLIDLAISRGGALGCAELMAQAFMELHAQGRVVREKCVFMAYVLWAVAVG